MFRINQKSQNNSIILSFIFSLIFIYIVLFEFIIPANKFLPKPSILLDSIPSLFNDYNFLFSFLFTVSTIYATMVISYFFIKAGNQLLINFLNQFPGLKNLFVLGKYFIPIFLVFLFELWFSSSVWGEYLYVLIIIMGILKESVSNQIKNIRTEFIDSAKSLGIDDSGIIKNVVWKSLQPGLFSSLRKNHIIIWGYLLLYEFICNTGGIGSIFNTALNYNDLSIVVLLITLTIFTFLIMEYAFEQLRKKYFFWT